MIIYIHIYIYIYVSTVIYGEAMRSCAMDNKLQLLHETGHVSVPEGALVSDTRGETDVKKNK